MADEIVAQAEPIPHTGQAEWFPPAEDDADAALLHQPQPTSLRWIFRGKEGLRAGWSIALFFLLVYLFIVAFRAVLHHIASGSLKASPGEQTIFATLVPRAFNFFFIAFSAWIVSLIEPRSFARYGLGLRGRLGQFAAGLGWGFLLLSLLVLMLKLTGVLAFGIMLLTGGDAIKWGAAWAVTFFVLALFEEFLSRGFLQFTLARGLAGIAGAVGIDNPRTRRVVGFWLAVLLFSYLFGAGHRGNAGESPIGLFSAGLIGLVFAFSLWRTGSLWWAVGWHAAWDWSESFLYGVSDSGIMVQHHLLQSHPQGQLLLSGGPTGPEGSVYVLVIILLAAVVIHLTLKPQPGSPSMQDV